MRLQRLSILIFLLYYRSNSKTKCSMLYAPGFKEVSLLTSKHQKTGSLRGLLKYCQELDRILIEEEGQLLCYNETSDTLTEENLRICLPLSLILACFQMGHCNELGGHKGASKTYANARYYYWLGIFDWICASTADCLTCQTNKPKPKNLNELPLKEKQGDTAPFCAIHIDNKRTLQPPSNRNTHYLLIVNSFSGFLMVYRD